ncbi:hypothetical protein [Hymenobacter glacialis]|uniref:Uncharacterized protein n=1 Tax=Hymenobacter glacialis TaxID=1908236 RepID=A0A1G1SRS6_9BACT|nr:hypothetical protein [Hymenobacter glacialis]OGX81305.1 hypothetical protein BEN48_06865 [Hymenobacter glacialis]
MASNLDYLNPAYLPLEDKVNDFLETQKALSRAQVALKTAQLPRQPQAPAASSYTRESNQLQQEAAGLQHKLDQLEREIIGMLPTRNEWLKVNLGYGPSRVGAWHIPAQDGAAERVELRVVH